MKNIIKSSFLALFTLILVVSACKKEAPIHANLDALDRNTIPATALDTWLIDNFLTPYNIDIKYRWDKYEVDFDKDLVPPKESQVQPAMETVRDIWIKPYETIGGANFMKINTPKQFYLVGSPSYNGDGTITLGTAEGGKKIVLFIINNFTKSNTAAVTEMIHVIEHEFTHILNQKIPYAPAFNSVTKADYTANWNIFNAADAKALGFISQYSRANPLDDFAEMTSLMLTMGNRQYNAYVAGMTADASTKIRKKEQYVVEYFKTAFNIDFYALQTEVTAAIDRNAPALNTVLGTGKTYTTFTANPSTQTPQSTEFLGLWNTAKASITAQGLNLTQYQFIFSANNLVTLRYTFTQTIGTTTTTYAADIIYNMVVDANGIANFTVAATPTGNYASLASSFAGINSYITGNQFKIDYAPNFIAGTKGLPGAFGAFYKTTNLNSYMIGTLN
jgi:substrate import-associated zinc metallohydrolase lipoprotein